MTLWARRLYEDIEDLTEGKLMRLVGARNEEGFKKEVIQLRQDMLRDLKVASRFPLVRREVIRQFGTKLEDVIFAAQKALAFQAAQAKPLFPVQKQREAYQTQLTLKGRGGGRGGRGGRGSEVDILNRDV